MHNKFLSILFFFGFFLSTQTFATSSRSCNLEQKQSFQSLVSDVICSPEFGEIYLKHDKKKRVIWLESQNKKIFLPLLKLEVNADPSIVGEEKSIGFITPKIITVASRQFIGLTVAERSMRGNGMGQCGAGSEVYFVALELAQMKILERKRFLIYSCKQNMYLADDGSKKNNPVAVVDDEKVIFRWLNYPDHEDSVTGSYSFITNELDISEDSKKK